MSNNKQTKREQLPVLKNLKIAFIIILSGVAVELLLTFLASLFK